MESYNYIFETSDSIYVTYDIRPSKIKESIILNEPTVVSTTYDTSQTSGINSGGLYRLSVTPSYALAFKENTNNTSLTVTSYSTGSTLQKFYINYCGSGQYSLIAYGTDKAVSTDGTYVGLYKDYGENAQRWYITKSGDNYIFRSVAYSSYYISSAASSYTRLSTSSSNAFGLQQINVIKAVNYYDQAYLTRIGSLTRISSICEGVAEYYKKVYNIIIEFSSTYRKYSSAVDKYGESFEAYKTAFNITIEDDMDDCVSYDFYNNKVSSSDYSIVNILWTGGFEDSNAVTRRDSTPVLLPAIVVMYNSNNGNYAESIYQCMLIHEFGHVLGNTIHADKKHDPAQYCIMSHDSSIYNRINTVLAYNSPFFCNYCLSTINRWKQSFATYCANNF